MGIIDYNRDFKGSKYLILAEYIYAKSLPDIWIKKPEWLNTAEDFTNADFIF